MSKKNVSRYTAVRRPNDIEDVADMLLALGRAETESEAALKGYFAAIVLARICREDGMPVKAADSLAQELCSAMVLRRLREILPPAEFAERFERTAA